VGTITRNDGYLDGVGRLRLHYMTWEVAEPLAGIVFVHSLGEHGGRYAHVAEDLAGHGYSSFAYDQRGHGLSEGRRGHVAHFGMLLQDLDRFRRLAQGLLKPGRPLFLLGQSMGGLVVLRFLEEYDVPLAGAIVCSPWLATTQPLPRWKTLVAPLFEKLLPALPLASGLRPEHLSHDERIVRAYRDDPLVHDRITVRLFGEVSRAMGLAVQRAERFQLPILLLLGGADRVVSTPRTLALASAVGGTLATVRVYPDMFHEVLNETARDRVLEDLRDWLAYRLEQVDPPEG
jgi:alpha-beta hydrolase superfamily lysophospholipase